ncbi:hypothetical protein LCGC14_3161870, partial [marine sediment metagenome]
KLGINIKGLSLEGKITSFKIDDKGKWFMQYKTTEEHPKIKDTQGKGAVTINVPWDDVKTEVEGKYDFNLEAMVKEVRALRSGEPTRTEEEKANLRSKYNY